MGIAGHWVQSSPFLFLFPFSLFPFLYFIFPFPVLFSPFPFLFCFHFPFPFPFRFPTMSGRPSTECCRKMGPLVPWWGLQGRGSNSRTGSFSNRVQHLPKALTRQLWESWKEVWKGTTAGPFGGMFTSCGSQRAEADLVHAGRHSASGPGAQGEMLYCPSLFEARPWASHHQPL